MANTFSWYNTSGALPVSDKVAYTDISSTGKITVQFQDLITNRGGKDQPAKYTPLPSGSWTEITCSQQQLKIPVSEGAIYIYFINIPKTNNYINTEDNVFRFFNHSILTKTSKVLNLHVMPIRATSEGYSMLFTANLDAKDANSYASPYLFLDQKNFGNTDFSALRVTLIFYTPQS